VREECLDWLLIAGRRHLDRVLRHFVEYYNRERPVERRDRLGGLLHEYYRAAA
jgi:hypothetical protein